MNYDFKLSTIMLFILCSFISVLQCCESKAGMTTEQKIEWLTSPDTAPIKAYTRNVENKIELAIAIDSAAEQYNVDVDYIIVIAWFETVFRNLIGDQGRSIGEMQVGEMGRRLCHCNMSTVASRINCGACWLSLGISHCGTVDSGLQAYISGDCIAQTANAKRSFIRRKRVIESIKQLQISQ